MREVTESDRSITADRELEREEDMVEDSAEVRDFYEGPFDADLVIAGDGSSIKVIIEPLPEDRHAEYKVCPPSNYVHRVIRRGHGRDQYEIEYSDGTRSKIDRRKLYRLPNGSKAVHLFKRKEVEEENELSATRNDLKRRRLWRNGESVSSSPVASIFASRSSSPPTTQSLRYRGETSTELDLDGSRDAILYMNSSHSRPRPLAERSQSSAEYSSNSASSEDDDVIIRDGRRSHALSSHLLFRPGQGRRVSSHRLIQDDDVDELGGDNDADFIPTIHRTAQVVSDARKGKWKHQFQRPTKSTDRNRLARDSSMESKDARRSSRVNKNRRSMVDPFTFDESLYADYELTPIRPRVTSLKEVFQPLDTSSPFRLAHTQICSSCREPATAPSDGVMIYCQGCSLAFHRDCIGPRKTREHTVTKVATESFVLQCRFCVDFAKTKNPIGPSLNRCSVCYKVGASCAPFAPKKSAKEELQLRQQNEGVDPNTPVNPELVNNADNILFRCIQCHRGFHYEHLPPPTADWVDEDSENIREERLAQYSTDGRCRDCLDMPAKIEAVIAWRPAARESVENEKEAAAPVSIDDVSEDDKEYLIKWVGSSYDHCEWRPGPWVVNSCRWTSIRQTFVKKYSGESIPPVFEKDKAFPAEYLHADIIFMVRYKRNLRMRSKKEGLACINEIQDIMVKYKGLSYEATVWDEVPPQDSGERWKTFISAYDEYLNGAHFKTDPPKSMRDRVNIFRTKKFRLVSEQPAVLQHGKLMPYQMEGLNWLLFNYYKGKSVVLADEMGLGKTVQIIAMLSTLIIESPRTWPFLIVVPNSTCSNWRREIKNWAPDLRVVSYHGGKASQSMAYEHLLFPGARQEMHAHVVIMSYESAQDDKTYQLFHKVRWSGLVVDEGQRLKNDHSLLYLALRRMNIGFRLLLTGTPLQNNKRELFNLLQFIDSSIDAAQLDKTYTTITAENLPELHNLIRPYFLRRTKAEVLGFLPPMAQIIVPVSMTVVQEKLCKSILSKNPQLVRSIFSKAHLKSTDRANCNNILMQLRKCLCHPFVYSGAIEEKDVEVEQMHLNLVEASAKLQLLKIMLPKLKERGHRVLIFSQFLDQLDIIEDFMHDLGMSYQRLDGGVSSLEKQRRIDAFNVSGSQLFAFLLSTRAGGVGINLATADTVIVLDPDFNPHQDIQAFSRAHRIGQKKKVLCFQFMTKDSVEEKIMQIGRSKMALDHALIETMDAEDDAGNDIESILRHGAEALFGEDAARDRIVYDDASVEKLLDRSQVENTRTDEKKSAESQFSFARVWANDMGTLADDIELNTSSNAADEGQSTNTIMLSVWDKIISEREAEAARLAESQREVLGRGGRRRTKVVYEQSHLRSGDGVGDGAVLDGDGNAVSDASPEKVTKKKRRSKDDDDGDFVANNDEDDSSEPDGSRSPSASLPTATGAPILTQGTQNANNLADDRAAQAIGTWMALFFTTLARLCSVTRG
ncbi:hypothetical protein SEPCBS119000_000993 [Sporothrix epigloea]|uniref:Chromatin remodeling complex subunit n=1 Tax=Sporothrix epigloea TaxID=1892477 RepID=A0ABP0D8I2_9PEZI